MERISNIFRDIACAAAIAVTAGFFGACTEEDNIIAEQPMGKTVHFTATLASKGADGATRSVDASGHTAWQVGEQISIAYLDPSYINYIKTTATVTTVNADGSAIIEATLNDFEDTRGALLIYPASLSNTDGYDIDAAILQNEQHGNLTGDNGICKLYDAVKGEAVIELSGTEAYIDGKVEMKNQVCICKFSLRIGTQGDGDTFTPSTDEFPTLTITVSGSSKTYTITSDKPKDGGGTRGFMDGDEIYVAMKSMKNMMLHFQVSNGTDVFAMTTDYGTLTKGTFYTNIPVKMMPAHPVTIPAGGTYTLTDATLFYIDNPAIVCEGDATIILEGDNTVLTATRNKAAIQAGPEGTTLTIQGSGLLTVTGGTRGAAIGCGESETCGNIEITGGTITATGGASGAGIGSGYASTCGDITITGGTITATGGGSGAGIGSGNRSTCGDITISGATITAKGGSSAPGIGSGYGSSGKESVCGDITISATTGIVTKGGSFATNSIGPSKYGTCGTVSVDGVSGAIATSPYYLGDVELLGDGDVLTGAVTDGRRVAIADGATVTLRDVTINNSKKWPGITCEGNATIILEGSNTVTTKTKNYSAIMPTEGKKLTIRGTGSLTATGGNFAASIGGGRKDVCGKIVIEGGTIIITGDHGTCIGSGYQGECDDITISGGTVVAVANNTLYGIGGHNCGNITISGGTVEAKGKCGIGGDDCGNVTITADITKVQATRLSKYSAYYPIGLAGAPARVGTITFDTEIMHVEGGKTWAITPTDGQDYGNLHFAVSTDTDANVTWTLTPVTP